MQKIILVDRSDLFTGDVESRMLLGDYDFDIVSVNNLNDLEDSIQKERPDKIVINASLLQSFSDFEMGAPIYSYARTYEDIKISNDAGIACYGLVKGVAGLLSAIQNDKVIQIAEEKPEKAETPQKENNANKNLRRTQSSGDLFGMDDENEKEAVKQRNDEETSLDDMPIVSPKQAKPVIKKMPKQKKQPQKETVLSDFEDEDDIRESVKPPKKKAAPPKSKPRVIEEYDDEEDEDIYGDDYEENNDIAEDEEDNDGEEEYEGSIKDIIAKKKKEENEKRKKAEQKARQQYKDRIDEEVEYDLLLKKDPAKVITVYSAKGGVGKTTIATELATYLALTSSGKGTYKVCVVDYNIDFGDVMNTLGMDPRKACMTLWAADIRERLKHERRKSIKYSKEEIEMYLQKDERSGLYALLAPITNEDSMEITDEELKIMLDNVVQYGEFDFVVCDTGNNTRDSSFIAITRAEHVLMVLTQNVNAANCNDSFLKMMERINFDTNKVKIIINRAVQGKQVSISTSELMEAFINPKTRQPYPCLSIIKDNIKVQYASNNSEPLVFNSSDKFTKSIGEIASYVIGDTFVLEAPKKKKRFSLFGGR